MRQKYFISIAIVLLVATVLYGGIGVPVASLTADAVYSLQDTTLDASSSIDADGPGGFNNWCTRAKFDWDDPTGYDDTTIPSHDGTISESYATDQSLPPGTYTAQVEVKDNEGDTDTATYTVYVLSTYKARTVQSRKNGGK